MPKTFIDIPYIVGILGTFFANLLLSSAAVKFHANFLCSRTSNCQDNSALCEINHSAGYCYPMFASCANSKGRPVVIAFGNPSFYAPLNYRAPIFSLSRVSRDGMRDFNEFYALSKDVFSVKTRS